jgi:nicotinamide riboside transporter PnuC
MQKREMEEEEEGRAERWKKKKKKKKRKRCRAPIVYILSGGAVVATMNRSQSDAAVNHGQPWQHSITTIFTGGALGAVLFPPPPPPPLL